MHPKTLILASALAIATAQSTPEIPAGLKAPDASGFVNATVHVSRGGAAVCVSGSVPVYASATNTKIDIAVPQNQTALTDLFLKLMTPGSTFVEDHMGGPVNVSGTFNIGATLCVPADDISPEQVHITTHGIPYNGYYWDFAPGYSYADIAAQHGHATFYYDRLGGARSDHPDGIQTVQFPLELEILNSLALKLRQGALSQTKFAKVIGLGHSFGSMLTTGVANKYPNAFDAAILTGYISLTANESAAAGANPSAFFAGFNAACASETEPLLYYGLDNSYVVVHSSIGLQYSFLRAPLDPQILNLAAAGKGTATIGELFNLAIVPSAANFTGIAAIINGDADLATCAGNCTYPIDYTKLSVPNAFPAARKTASYVVPNSGHGINLQYGASAAFEWVQEFLQQNL